MGHLVGSVNGSGVSFCGDENILELGSGDGYTTLRRLKNHCIGHFRRVNFVLFELYPINLLFKKRPS